MASISCTMRGSMVASTVLDLSMVTASVVPSTRERVSWYLPRKVRGQVPIFYQLYYMKACSILGNIGFHSCPFLKYNHEVVEKQYQDFEKASSGNEDDGNAKVNKKKLKGKRAVVRWMKFFRFKKKKEYERMTTEEKILYKLLKARKKEERLCEALKKIEPAESSETTHDPEILTPEEHFFFLKMGLKCKNYVPVGRRGIYQGVILNMHLHWKKHQTLKVVVKTFSAEEVKEIAVELARLTGGIVLDIHEDNTIIMYRGKNYSQPPTEIMSPRVSLSRKKALDKSKYRDALRAVRRHIPRLEQELEILQAQFKSAVESNIDASDAIQKIDRERILNFQSENSDKHEELMNDKIGCTEDETDMDSEFGSDSDKLSDIFETDSDVEKFTREEKPLYLDEFDKFPEQSDVETNDFEEHLRQMSLNSRYMEKDQHLPKLDEVDKIFLRATSFLKKKIK
ncbi:hypothetical protein VNO80_23923 [Phaseolus coccineus]|uniref:CRM domain-containing protein n=1 Tax=Phaseolus coccineus TaxID=3886 RepID=A0AAN9QME1_PHACN